MTKQTMDETVTRDKREHRDRMFIYLFGNPKYREFTLDLYNALNHSSYDNPEELEFNTLEDAVFVHMNNDCSFVIHNELHIFEQQSSWNPNMPLRELLYYDEIIRRDIRKNNPRALHSSSKHRIPVPRFYVFYNGIKHQPLEEMLYLSDLFESADPSQIEKSSVNVTVKMININCEEGNRSLLESCRPLLEYSELMEMIRKEKESIGLENAIRKAIASVTEEWKIYRAVTEAGKEMEDMILAEFNQEAYEKGLREDGIKIGKEEGRKEAHLETVIRMIGKNYSDEEISDIINSFSPEEIAALREDLKNHPEHWTKYRSN